MERQKGYKKMKTLFKIFKFIKSAFICDSCGYFCLDKKYWLTRDGKIISVCTSCDKVIKLNKQYNNGRIL